MSRRNNLHIREFLDSPESASAALVKCSVVAGEGGTFTIGDGQQCATLDFPMSTLEERFASFEKLEILTLALRAFQRRMDEEAEDAAVCREPVIPYSVDAVEG